ncbi:MAG: carbohydrate ABC transporter permease [Chloroflexota bacterium]
MADSSRVTPRDGNTLRQLAREYRAARSRGWGNPWGYVFIAPALVIYLIFNVWPILRGFTMAFTDYRYLVPGSEWDWNGLSNFKEMFTNDSQFWPSLSISVTYSILDAPIGIVIALVVAILISRVTNGVLAGTYRVITYLPVILPISVALLLWNQLYDLQFGYLNLMLTNVFGVSSPPNWLGDPSWALPSIVGADVWKGFGANTLLFLVGIYGISRELYEAASIDGAGPIQQIWSITLPLLRPVFLLVLVLYTSVISVTEQPLIMTNGGPQNATLTLGLYLYQQAFQFGDLRLGYAAAMSLFLGLISMCLAALAFRLLRPERD